LRTCQTVGGATVMPSPASSPWIRRYPHDSFSRASRSTTDRTLRRTGGRPGRPRLDQRAQRRRTMSRCHRRIVPGVTMSRIAVRRSTGTVPASSASHARSGHVSRVGSLRPLTQGDRELMAQHEDPGVLPPRLPARQPGQRHDTGDDQEDLLQAHNRRSSHHPARPTHARPTPDARPSRRRAAVHLPRWHKFSARTMLKLEASPDQASSPATGFVSFELSYIG
jgi:hypothetical protein